jgi:hypothetical protein
VASVKGSVRRATEADIEAMLDLAEARRRRYAAYHPRFHRPASGAREVQRPFFFKLLSADNYIVLVHEHDGRVDGFLTGQITAAPPVYDPGGLTCLVDDFAVETQEDWLEVGHQLLEALRVQVRERQAVQIVVVCAPEDKAKRAMLTEAGLSVVSEWLVATL